MATEVFSLPVSTSLLTEVNAVGAPNRLKAQDGTVGDTTHEEKVSDHNRDETGNTGSSSDWDDINEVHARDVDSRGPWLIKGGAERIVQLIVANVRAAGYARRRVKYVIFRRRIWEWVGGAFVQRAYAGADPHEEHFHVSFMYGSGSGSSNPENNTAPWGILAAYEQEQGVSEQDAYDGSMRAMKEFFKRGEQSDNRGITSRIGEDTAHQGTPNPLRGANTPFWQVITDTAAAVKALAMDYGLTSEQMLAAIGEVDEQVLLSLADASRSDEDVAAALRAALGDRAAAVGALLAGTP